MLPLGVIDTDEFEGDILFDEHHRDPSSAGGRGVAEEFEDHVSMREEAEVRAGVMGEALGAAAFKYTSRCLFRTACSRILLRRMEHQFHIRTPLI
jgi:hypothetical protein